MTRLRDVPQISRSTRSARAFRGNRPAHGFVSLAWAGRPDRCVMREFRNSSVPSFNDTPQTPRGFIPRFLKAKEAVTHSQARNLVTQFQRRERTCCLLLPE